jgi:hypothetical protein
VPLLSGGLLRDLDGLVLADDLVDQLGRDLKLRGGLIGEGLSPRLEFVGAGGRSYGSGGIGRRSFICRICPLNLPLAPRCDYFNQNEGRAV